MWFVSNVLYSPALQSEKSPLSCFVSDRTVCGKQPCCYPSCTCVKILGLLQAGNCLGSSKIKNKWKETNTSLFMDDVYVWGVCIRSLHFRKHVPDSPADLLCLLALDLTLEVTGEVISLKEYIQIQFLQLMNPKRKMEVSQANVTNN